MFRNGERMGTIKFNQFQGTPFFIQLTIFVLFSLAAPRRLPA